MISTVLVLPGQLAAGLSGYMIGYLGGFQGYFVVTALMGIPGILLAFALLRATRGRAAAPDT